MTIPAENISAVNFDVISAEHSLDANQGYITKATMVNSANIREIVPTSPGRMMSDLARGVRELSIDEKRIR